MKILQRILFLLLVTIGLLSVSPLALAAVQTKLTLTPTTGDAVQVSISAEVEKQIQLSYLPPGEPVLRTIVLGVTDAKGSYSTTVSSGGYGIPPGSPVFATVSGVQSPMTLWPTYTSSLTLSKTTIQLAVGQSVTVNGSAALILAANSQNASIATSVSGSQVTITGSSSGSGTVTVCAINLGCNSIAVEVGAQTGQTQIAFSPETPVLLVGQSTSIVILGGGTAGYSLASNSNPTAVEPSFTGTQRVLYVYANAAGSSTLKICSRETSTNCSTIVVTVLDNTITALSFSPNSITLIPGLTQRSTVSGGPDNNYYVSSNSNSSAAQASVSGNVLTVVGGSTAGSTTITVCSATTSNRCGNFTVTLNTTSSASSATTLVFSQNVVSVASGETTNVTVTGGNNSGYAVASNTNPSSVTASIHGSSNVVSLTGNSVGTAIIAICSATAGSTCASLYVTVSASLPTIILSQNTTTLTPAAKALISITGGSSATTVTSNTNPNAVTAVLSNNGMGIILTGGTTPGTAVITVCPTDAVSSKCATVTATTSAPGKPETPVAPIKTTNSNLVKVNGESKVYLLSNGKKQWIKTEAEFKAGGYKWSDITMTTAAILATYPDVTVSPVTIKITGTQMLNVRQSNTTKTKVVGTVNQDQTFTLLEEKNGWYKISISPKVMGWISGAYTKKQ